MEVTVKYIIKNFIDEYSFVNEFNGDAVKCYEMVSDNILIPSITTDMK